MGSEIDSALKQFDATEANLLKLECLWQEIEDLTPQGLTFAAASPEAMAYENNARAFKNIVSKMPTIDGHQLQYCIMDLYDIAQSRIDAHEVDDIDFTVSVERAIRQQGVELEEFRFKFDNVRRQLVRNIILDVVRLADADLAKLKKFIGQLKAHEHIVGQEWDSFKEHVAQINMLLGSRLKRPKGWNDLFRHIKLGLTQDLNDIINTDWPNIKDGLEMIVYEKNDPVLVEIDDLGKLVMNKPDGPIATRLKWKELSDHDFEWLIFCLIDAAKGYENPEWLTQTNAPDRGRDLSVIRIREDELSGTQRQRVIIQCKHWLSKSVNVPEIAAARDQMKLHEPPSVDVLIVVTSGRFTSDAVNLVEKHNQENKRPTIEMWPDSHLERLLAARASLIAQFNLR